MSMTMSLRDKSAVLWIFLALIGFSSSQGCSGAFTGFLVVDGSESISNTNFELVRSALVTFVNQSISSNGMTRVGVVVYSNSVSSVINASSDITSLVTAIQAVAHPQSGTFTHLGIRRAIQLLDVDTSGNPHIMIVMTDGLSNYPDVTRAAATEAKNSGIRVFAVGVNALLNFPTSPYKRRYEQELADIASDNSTAIQIEDFRHLAGTVANIVQSLCSETVSVANRPTSKTLLVGGTASFTVGFNRQPTGGGSWRRIRPSLADLTNDNRFIKSSNNYERTLTVPSVTLADGGIYAYSVGSLNPKAMLTVFTPLTNLTRSAGQTTIFETQVTPNDAAQGFWLKDGVPLSGSSSKYTILTTATGRSLVVHNVESGDQGRYTFSLNGVITSGYLTVTGCSGAFTGFVVVDGSESISNSNFELVRSALVTFVNQSISSNGMTRVGVVVYSNSVSSVINASSDITSLVTAIQAVAHPKSGTFTHLGIRRAKQLLDVDTSGNPPIMIVMTDGLSNYPDVTRAAATEAKNSGIRVFAVGVNPLLNFPTSPYKRRYEQELADIASDNSTEIQIEDFSHLAGTVANIVQSLCSETVSVANRPTSKTLLVGGTASFTVGFNRQPTGGGSWRRIRPSLADLTNDKRFIKSSNNYERTLTVPSVTLADGGIYAYSVGSLNPKAMLTVFTPLTNLTRSAGQTTTFETQFTPNDAAQGFWLKDGVPLSGSSSKYTISTSATGRSLVVHNVESSDQGRYTFSLNGIITSGYLTVTGCSGAFMGFVVVDGSESISNTNFELVRSALVTFVNQSISSNGMTRVGVVVYSNSVSSVINASSDITSLVTAIQAVAHPKSGTFTHLGIRRAKQLLDVDTSGNPPIMIVMTDGLSNYPDVTRAAATEAKNSGIRVFAVGVNPLLNFPTSPYKRRYEQELADIASDNSTEIQIEDFSHLAGTVANIVQSLCSETVSVANRPTSKTLLVGGTASFTVGFNQQPTGGGSWRRIRPSLADLTNDNRFIKSSNNYERTLTVPSVTLADGGIYAYSVGSLNPKAMLTVFTPLTNLTRSAGQTTIFETQVTPNDAAQGFWLKDGVPLSGSSSKYTILTTATGRSLVVHNVESGDQGRYTFSLNGVITSGYLTVTGCSGAFTGFVVVDGSESISNTNFELVRSALVTFVNQSISSNGMTRVGVVVYSNSVSSVINASSDITSLVTAIQAVAHPKSGTFTHLGIRRAKQLLDVDTSGNPHIMIVMTDGLSNYPDVTRAAATEAKNSGIRVFAVGVNPLLNFPTSPYKRRYEQELADIASDNSTEIQIEDFSHLAGTVANIVQSLCSETVSVANRPTSKTLLVGGTASFTVGFNQQPTGGGSWRRIRPSLADLTNDNRFIKSSNNYERTLTVPSVTLADGGIYAYSVGSLYPKAMLTVFTPLTNLTRSAGQTTIFETQVTPNDAAQGFWLKDGVPLSGSSSKYTILTTATGRSLVVHNVESGDQGRYTFSLNGVITSGYLTVTAINGGISMWSHWLEGPCSATCGAAVRNVNRNRICTKPVPQYGGDDCREPRSESITRACSGLPSCPTSLTLSGGILVGVVILMGILLILIIVGILWCLYCRKNQDL